MLRRRRSSTAHFGEEKEHSEIEDEWELLKLEELKEIEKTLKLKKIHTDRAKVHRSKQPTYRLQH